MKRTQGTCWISILGALVLLAAAQARAEMVSHHGLLVDANGRAAACISCHDGKEAKNISICTTRCDYASSHAVLKDYPPAGKADKYAPAAALQAQGIKLEDGKVTCISCHDLKRTARYHLVMSNVQSRLCLACHVNL